LDLCIWLFAGKDWEAVLLQEALCEVLHVLQLALRKVLQALQVLQKEGREDAP